VALGWLLRRGDSDRAEGPPPDYEKAKAVAANGDAKAKARLASDPSLQPEFLYFFATDESKDVRRAVARNSGTPIQADVILARDRDAEVKMDLGDKIAKLLPGLSSEENEKVTEMVVQVVETLAADTDVKVRANIAKRIQSIDTIPPRIAQRLAKDTEELVAAPILQFSPLLNEDDLMAIISAGCRGSALAAMAKRKALPSAVGGAIAETEDDVALPALLGNASAKLSPDTLAAVVEAAADKPGWHDALVGRKDLTKGLMKRMVGFLSGSALDKLVKDNVLVDDALEKELRAIAPGGVADEAAGPDDADEAKSSEEEARAMAMHERGELKPAAMIKAVERKEREFVIHALALLAQSDSRTIRKLISDKDPKLPISIAWHCKLGMNFALALEKHMMDLTTPLKKGEGGAYPMTEDDMAWALEVAGVL
jgi:uncharacterized protein (DUF2336 family)